MKRFSFICAVLLTIVGLTGARQAPPGSASKGILRHTVAFNFKPDVSQETIEQILDEARKELPTIEGTSNIVVGPQTSNWTKYKYGISIDFVNKDAKEAYAKSPQSRRLHEQYKKFTEDEVVIDILSE
ncbi:MAG TPA: Dabb family protein [Pyrinomonadaceae bacterium]|nr:Dabb family protein [Pyrinomonadaceae bacterium]